jgi:hypothetical protein
MATGIINSTRAKLVSLLFYSVYAPIHVGPDDEVRVVARWVEVLGGEEAGGGE